jgi:hypothetical protein
LAPLYHVDFAERVLASNDIASYLLNLRAAAPRGARRWLAVVLH